MRIGLCLQREIDPAQVPVLARAADGRLDELWVIEDCFYTAGPSLAGAALASTEQLSVGIGIVPSRIRSAALTAMEFATLGSLGPGRFIGGIGHGVQAWLGQIGLASASPLTALAETLDVVRDLLAGRRVDVRGRYVRADDVQLDMPPTQPVPVFAGVQRPKSFAVAGAHADGLILAGTISPEHAGTALAHAAAPGDFELVVFSSFIVAATREAAYEHAAPWLESELRAPSPAMTTLPFFSDLQGIYERGGREALRTIPAHWWLDLGAIGTPEDALEHVHRLGRAGASAVCFFGAPSVPDLRADIAAMAEIAAHVGG